MAAKIPHDFDRTGSQSLPKTSLASWRTKVVHFILVAVVCSGLLFRGSAWFSGHVYKHSPSRSPDDQHEPAKSSRFRWKDVKPDYILNYVPCYQDQDPTFECAKLRLPLDPLNASETRKVTLAIVRYPAPVNVTSSRYGGAFFMNPGGPGAAGTDVLTEDKGDRAKLIQRSVSDLTDPESEDGGLIYDVISWDPRAVGESSPGFEVFKSPAARQDWAMEEEHLGTEFQHKNVLNHHIAQQKAFARLLRTAVEEQPMGKFITTTSNVRDMIGLIEAHGKWREKQARRIMETDRVRTSEEKSLVLKKSRYIKGEETLNFWGFSYGTVVAQYFASMYPHRYNRMIIDGVGDVQVWMEPYKRYTYLDDLDQVTEQFARQCFMAGPLKCRLWRASGPNASLEAISQFFDQLTSEGPISDVVDGVPMTGSTSDFQQLMWLSYYHPQQDFQKVDAAIAAGINGDLGPLSKYTKRTSCGDAVEKMRYSDTGGAISCVDSPPEQWKAFLEKGAMENLLALSLNRTRLLRGYGFNIADSSGCAGLHDFHLPERLRFTGPFGFRTLSEQEHKPNPILFASAAWDPITPLSAARSARANFAGSGLLVHEVPGHCTKAWKNKCVEDRVREYVATGKVDPNGEVWCAQEGKVEWNT